MTESVRIHHPEHARSEQVVTRKAFDVIYSREGYLEGARPKTPDSPPPAPRKQVAPPPPPPPGT